MLEEILLALVSAVLILCSTFTLLLLVEVWSYYRLDQKIAEAHRDDPTSED